MKHIMAAVDGSECSYRALEFAIELAQKLETELTILIVQLYVIGRMDIHSVLSSDELRAIQDRVNKIVLAADKANASVLVEKSRDTSFTIVEVAIDRKVDLIVMGASGKGGFKTFLLGSISQEVLRKSACPVTIVH